MAKKAGCVTMFEVSRKDGSNKAGFASPSAAADAAINQAEIENRTHVISWTEAGRNWSLRVPPRQGLVAQADAQEAFLFAMEKEAKDAY